MHNFTKCLFIVAAAAYSIARCVAAPAIAPIEPGEALLNQGKFPEAVTWFSKAIKSSPKNPTLFEWRGRAYFYRGATEFTKLGNRGTDYLDFYQKAADDFSTEIQLDPKNVNAHVFRGLAYERLNQSDKAITDFSKAYCARKNCIRRRSLILRRRCP
jgi:tetratricopeptide (TPR) repeat protein